MKVDLKMMSLTIILPLASIPIIAIADYTQNLGMLPLSEMQTAEQRYNNASQGATDYVLDCSTGANDDKDYSITYYFRGDKRNAVAARLAGGENFETHQYIENEIIVDEQSGSITFKGIGILNSKLNKFTLEDGTVERCKRDRSLE